MYNCIPEAVTLVEFGRLFAHTVTSLCKYTI